MDELLAPLLKVATSLRGSSTPVTAMNDQRRSWRGAAVSIVSPGDCHPHSLQRTASARLPITISSSWPRSRQRIRLTDVHAVKKRHARERRDQRMTMRICMGLHGPALPERRARHVQSNPRAGCAEEGSALQLPERDGRGVPDDELIAEQQSGLKRVGKVADLPRRPHRTILLTSGFFGTVSSPTNVACHLELFQRPRLV
jgi:hypothetical protein